MTQASEERGRAGGCRELDLLKAEIASCRACPLGGTRTNAVPGEGPADAEIMCIGEAPGLNEDRQGRPFVGAAGGFLEECLARAGYRREDVYICNLLKCRPPNNRDPEQAELAACSSFLARQLETIHPLVVVTLGRFSMTRFFPGRAISRVHGRWKELGGRFFVPMYHPAAALHQGSLRSVILDDFDRLPRIIERARRSRAEGHAGADSADDADSTRQISLFE
ncbi:MAG: uracil-DNA glycosylase family protein [Dehalococcoidia bacterium]